MRKFIRLATIYFFAGMIFFNPEVRAQNKNDNAVNWQNLNLTGAYYKKKARKGIALWPIFVAGGVGAGVGGYFIYKGTLTEIGAGDDMVSVSCQRSTSVDVLANDRGDGLEIVEVYGQPEGISIYIAPNNNLNIENVGNHSFNFKYKIRDKRDNEAEAVVSVNVENSELEAVDDYYTVTEGGLIEGNVLENDIGTSIIVISYSEFTSGTVQVDEDGSFTLQASDTICGMNHFTYTVEDFCENTDTATVYVESEDDLPPEVACPPDVTVECTDDTSPDSTGRPEVKDNCDANPEVSYADEWFDGNCPSNKTLRRTWSAVDISQNSGSCVQTINVRDNTPPVITCPPNVSLICGESLEPSATGRATATDNCTATEDIVITYTDNLDGLTDCGGSTGTIIRTWKATDLCGNESTCVQNIFISDDIPPEIFCPPNLTIGCDQGIDPETTSRPTASDNCTAAAAIHFTYVDNIEGAIDCSASGVVTRTWTATDLCGNYNTCIQVINVKRIAGPEINCPPAATVSCDASTDPSQTGRPTATTSCSKPGEITFDYHDNSGGLNGCGNTGVIVRTWTATDPCNISSTCTQNINVIDNTPPVVNCPADITISCDASTDPSNTGTATATDNCSAASDVTLTYTDDRSGMTGCGNTGTILRKWTATDACGNTASCTQTITVRDTTPPVITCPADIEVECDAGTDPSNTGRATATDNCVSNGNITINYSDNTSGLTGCGGTGTLLRTWTASDPCGNSSSCVQTITIKDETPPVIHCPANITVSCEEGIAPALTGRPTVNDNCTAQSAITVDYSDDESGRTGCNGTGVVVRTWTATDACGNTAQCNQTITIEDSTPPAIICPADVVINCDESTDPSNTGRATATDNCTAEAQINITFADNTSGLTGCNGTGTLVRTWTATDLCGNQNQCIQNITIQDVTPPVLSCPPNISIKCDDPTDPSFTGQATATDNCTPSAGITITYSDVVSGVLDCSGNGRIDRTWTAADACGNVQTCVQTILVRPIAGPTINCPSNITISCEEDTSSNNTGTPTGATACTIPGELVFTHSDDVSGLTGCNGTGVLLRTWTVTDPCDLSNSCVQQITIEDATPPVISCPAAVTVECDASTDPSDTGTATATDNCTADADIVIDYSDNTSGLTGCNGTGTLIRTWTATDACGNVSQCTQNITIEDTTPPQIVCPANITISCDQSTDPSHTGIPVVSDNCGAASDIIVTYTDVTAGPGDCSGITHITRTWTATDPCGNSATCVQQITMEPVNGPDITCPPDVTIACTDSSDPSNTGTATATTDCILPGEITIDHTDNFAPSCGSAGVITRTWTATDPCGLSSTCTQTITIQDNQPPVLTLPANATIECGESTDPSNTGQATATDACSAVNVTYTDASSGSCPETITRTWTATDECWNTSTGTQTITIQDTTDPVLTLPANATIECGESTDPSHTGQATATDACSTATVAYTDASSGSCPETITRTWTATDACGNTATGNQIITVNDTQSPAISCPADIKVNCDEGTDPSVTGSASANDACSGPVPEANITYSDNITIGSCANNYTITRTWTAVDDCGNSATCNQTITVEDRSAPTITCPADATVTCSEDRTPAALGNATATDNCTAAGDISITYLDDFDNADTINCTGYIVRTWTADDECGNSASCFQRINLSNTTTGGRIAAAPENREESPATGNSVLTNGSEFQIFIDNNNALRLDLVNYSYPFTEPVLYNKDMEIWQTRAKFSFRADISYRRYFLNDWFRPFVGAGFVLFKNVTPGAYSNDYLNGQIAYSGDKYDYWITYVSGGALIRINKFLYYELSLRMNKDFSENPEAVKIIKLRPTLSSRFLFMLNRGGFR